MSLFVTSGINNVDTGSHIKTVNLEAKASDKGAVITIDAFIHEDDTTLFSRYVSATLSWDDGSAPISYPKTAGGLFHVFAFKTLRPGTYVVTLNAQNYRSPVEDTVTVNYFILVNPPFPPENPPRYIFGPILPRDSGFPNVQQWEFNVQSDLYILESSVKMLLLTAKGDRVMEPTYGTNLRRILFELNIDGVDSLVQEEIVSALSIWEPRLTLVSSAVHRDPNNRAIQLNMVLASKLNKQSFETSVQFVR